MRSLADDLVEAKHLDQNDTERFVSVVEDAARAGRFSMSLTMFAVVGTLVGGLPTELTLPWVGARIRSRFGRGSHGKSFVFPPTRTD